MNDYEKARRMVPQHRRPEDEEAVEYLLGRQAAFAAELEVLRFKGMFAPTSSERMQAQSRLTDVRFELAKVDCKLDDLGYANQEAPA